ncbi:LPS-assembly protein LptD [Paracoccus suum]|uniref:LPS-assembly protein LptD n=1 Tax=Paracoccus suum TaxID=2259340 RepID=A0A344PGH1_9RHOB|nr:LPS-assembly protein LptD [Paracoccus suum]
MATLALTPPVAAQQAVRGPALAPLTAPLGPSARPDGSEATIQPQFVPASRLGDATPERPVGPGAEATLLADQVTLSGDRQLEASGGVVVWYQGTRLVAPRVLYDGAADRLRIEGPIHLSRPGDRGTDREAALIADAATLDATLREGILRGARLVLARELQLAATEVRVRDSGPNGEGGRVTVLDRVAASSCRVCASNPTPLWEIRARRITHDTATHRLTFERPQFRAFGLPVAAVPFAISAPDPTVDRMTGFLPPILRTTSHLGFGVQVPWFRTLGDSADLTLAPYLAASRTATLNTRYRQAFANGALEWRGALSRDDLKDGTRGYSFAAAEFALPQDFQLGAQLQWTSDRDYLDDYGITDADTLWSGVTLQRVRREQLIALSGGAYRTLREGEDQDLLPTQVLDAQWQQVLPLPSAIGGRATLGWMLHGHRRPSGLDDLGRDVARASMRFDWQRSEVLAGGVLAEAALRLDADAWQISDDRDSQGLTARAKPTVGLTFRWPLVRGAGAGADVIEPVLALAWSPRRSAQDELRVPNEDSVFPELDEGNIYALNRLPGRDRTETGLRAAAGVGWTRLLSGGGSVGVTLVHLWRDDQDGMPASAAPLQDPQNWMLGANVQRGGLAAAGRAVLDEDGDLASGDLRLGWVRPDLQLTAGFAHVAATDTTDRNSQIGFDAGWQVREGLWARASGRYDLSLDQAQKLALGVSWRNECLSLEAEVDRDWDLPAGSRPDTGFNLSVRLGGFGRSDADRAAGTVARRSCMR